MASSMMHLAIAGRLLDGIARPDLLRLGCVLVDAAGRAGHFHAKAPDGRRYYDLERFRRAYGGRMRSDDFCLGCYLHLAQDMVYRKFVYDDRGWSPSSPEQVERLYNDYRLLNPILLRRHGLKPLTLPGDLAGHPLLAANAPAFLEDMAKQFAPYDGGEPFFLTETLAEEYIDRAAEVCLRELDALRGCGAHVNPLDYTYAPAFQIRELTPPEVPLLRDFLYEAIFQREGEPPLPREVIDRPELRVYIEDFGKKRGDLCLCAESNGEVAGAVWVRIIPGYGHLDDDTPEFAISILKPWRGRGFGTRLMQEMLKALRARGWKRASLAVQKDNCALRMYRKVGFQTVGENDEEYIMAIEL